MDLQLNNQLGDSYRNRTQKMRVITENWVEKNMYCPICGKTDLCQYTANKPVADFYCGDCMNDFELKSKIRNQLGSIINDGAYDTMIKRLKDFNNPNFLFLTHKSNLINNFMLIPNHYFVPAIIIRRNPLGAHARRAGWVGCNIDISDIPQTGKIFIIKDGVVVDKKKVLDDYARTKSLVTNNMESRGWLMDVLLCIERMKSQEFTIAEMYEFEDELQMKHIDNNNVKAKIRQQLQILRDKGFVRFVNRGEYVRL